MDADGDRDPRISPGEFLQHVEVRDEVEPEAVVPLRHPHGEEAELSQFAVDVGVEAILVRVPGLRRGLQPLLGKLAGERENLFRLGREFERRPGAAPCHHASE